MNHDALVKAVIVLNRMRILSRFRSRHAQSSRTKSKAPLLRRLGTATELLRNSSTCSSRVQDLARDINNLQKEFDYIEAMDSLDAQSSRLEEHLLGLVKSIHSILLQYEDDLKLIPPTPGIWSGNATEALIERLRKVSHYIKACDDLLRAARRYGIFSRIAVEFVDLQQHGKRVSLDAPSDIHEIIQASCTRETLSRVASCCGKSISDAKEHIKARLGQTSRLHAEIQLALYYEQEGRPLRPRVICSNKSACYLCHLLLQIHGQYYIPSTHGRLYDTWKWPMPTQLPNITGRGKAKTNLQWLLPEFSSAIDRKIQECLAKARKVKRMEPMESRVNLLAAMTPSVLSYHSRNSGRLCDAEMDEVFGAHVNGILTNEDKGHETSNKNANPILELMPSAQTPPPQIHTRVAESTSCERRLEPTIRQQSSEDSLPSLLRKVSIQDSSFHETILGSDGLQRVPLRLQKGEFVSHSLDQENRVLLIHAPGLHVTLEYDASLDREGQMNNRTPPGQGKSFQIEAQCLSFSKYPCGNLSHVVDLDQGSWVEKVAQEGVLLSTEGLLLRRRSTLLRLRVQ